jgi:hypothetical protein
LAGSTDPVVAEAAAWALRTARLEERRWAGEEMRETDQEGTIQERTQAEL